MVVAAKSLFIGLLIGLFLALLAPQLLPVLRLPIQDELDSPLPWSQTMAQVFKNIAKRGAGGYKSLWAAPTSASSIRVTATSSLTSSIPRHSSFSTTTAKMSNQKNFFDAVKDRRTYYQLNKEAPISDKQITDIVEKAILHVPSSFNSQSTRLVVLLNQEHEQFWDFVLEVLKPLTPAEQFQGTTNKINGFKAAKGTVSTHHLFNLLPAA